MRKALYLLLWLGLPAGAWAQVPVPGMPLPGMSWRYSYVDRAVESKRATIVVEVLSTDGSTVRDGALVEGQPQGARVAAMIDADETRFIERALPGGIVLSEFAPYLLAQDGHEQASWSAITGVAAGVRGPWRVSGRAVGWETVTVRAGTFRALRVEIAGERGADLGANRRVAPAEGKAFRYRAWYAKETRRPVKVERRVIADSNAVILNEVIELLDHARR